MEISEIKLKAIEMADKVFEILDLIEDGFMKNKMEFLTVAMQEEGEINKAEKMVTENIAVLSRSGADKKTLSSLAQTAEMLERMGDEATGLIERIEVKVNEKLRFSEEAVREFGETYRLMKDSVQMLREFLRTDAPALKKKIIDNGFRVKELVENHRKAHADRLVQGQCTPMSANMYFDMLDFTGNLARHSSNIVKLG
ncbi:MAG: PhoU domain-containing protein [Candidatus Omnitrophota bacterium]